MRFASRLTAYLALVALLVSCTPDSSRPDEQVVSQFTRHLLGLDEDVAFVVAETAGSGSHKFAIRSDGRRQSPGQVLREDREAYAARFGALSPALVRAIEVSGEEELIPISVFFELPAVWEELMPGLQSDQTDDRRLALQALGEAIAAEGDRLVAELSPLGVRRIAAAAHIPAVFGEATPEVIRQAARLPGITCLGWENPGEGAVFGPSPPSGPSNAITTPHIDTVLNAQGYDGTGQGIGIIEWPLCKLYDEHDNFANTTIVEEDLPSVTSCTTNGECGHCGDFFPFMRCVNGKCIAGHASRMASTIVNSVTQGTYGAFNATLFHPTHARPCSQQGIADGYSWLLGNVTTTVESFGCDAADDGLAQDFYARWYGFAVFRAAGNLESYPTTTEGCRTRNSICVGGMEPTPSGGWEIWDDVYNGTNGSAWINPSNDHTDREEPNIVALSQGVEVIDTSAAPNTTKWTWLNGTSYAAPAMAGMGALLKQACGGSIDPKFLRAFMMTSAWSINPDGKPYSTPGSAADCPGSPPDCKDGAGAPTAENALRFCQPPGPDPIEVGGGTLNVDLEGGSEIPWIDDGKGNPTGPFKLTPLKIWPLRQGDRLRVTFTWDGCPASAVGQGPSPLSADIDIFLCVGSPYWACLKTSRSYEDNVEGFDFTVSPGDPETGYTLYYGYDPDNSPGCGLPYEPAAWAYAVGPSAFFGASTTSIEPSSKIEFHIFGDVAEATLALAPDGAPVATVTAGADGGEAGVMFVIPTVWLDELLCPEGCAIMEDGIELETTRGTRSVAYWATTTLEPNDVVVFALKAGKVTLCHVPPGNPGNAHTISVGAAAVAAHLAHGDTVGPCPGDSG